MKGPSQLLFCVALGLTLAAYPFSCGPGSSAPAAPRPSTSSSSPPAATMPNAIRNPRFATRFEVAENSLSESNAWINGRTGLDWADVRTVKGLAFGTESGKDGYDDSTALLAGDWPADQAAQATVHTANQKAGDIYEEVELRLRSTLSPHRCTGYEINFRCLGHDSGYNQIVRWEGPLGKFKILSSVGGGAADGDTIKATMIGNVITVYRNGVQVNRAVDDTFRTGSPGIGFYLQGGPPALNSDHGLTSFSAEALDAPPATTRAAP